ncbi:hypothetical protein [Pelagibacterium mangrovi]|uniref:hypothetical protein n=1 Tax=Pelagibacterium mangrovi TaxID=3119828 RepID=UPI002FC999B6
MRDSDDQDQKLEQWLINEVVPAYDELKAHPESGLTIEQVRAHIAELHGQIVEES